MENKGCDAGLSQKEVKKVYDSLAGVYDFWEGFFESSAHNRSIKIADIKDGESILEVAVGTGLAFYKIVRMNPRGTNIGIDISEGMLVKARKRMSKTKNANYELRIASAFDIPYPDNTFDLLFNAYMLDLVAFDDMERILAEFKRVLKENGKMVLLNITEGGIFTGVYNFFYRLSPKMLGGCRPVKMLTMVKSGGFDIVKKEYFKQWFVPAEIIVAKAISVRGVRD